MFEHTEILERINRAATVVPVRVDQLLAAAELMAACADVGLKPRDLLEAVIDKYPHHGETIVNTLEQFYHWGSNPRIEDQP